jgi:hypothetical protein
MDHLDWYPGFELYKFYMKGRRLEVRFTQAEIADNGFIALYAETDPALLPRPPQARGFRLHCTLGNMSHLQVVWGLGGDCSPPRRRHQRQLRRQDGIHLAGPHRGRRDGNL